MRNIISIFGLLYLCGLSEVSFSQLQVTPNNNATQLAQSLAGNGVTISGATMNCPSLGNNAAGTFNGTFSNIGISSGVLLTTGSVINAVGPNNTPMAYTDNQVTFSDPDIVAIEPSAIHDVCILEFDAVPTCNSMAFTFAFGSEEYNEYVPSPTDTTGVNDCFGIFVTGVNPSGPAYSGYNMALIPATTTPVSIFNVNNGYDSLCPSTGPCKNCAYFIDNCNGPSIQYDGFTKPITVTLSVVPCNSYHYKLAIADAYDGEYDSGVFFATQSLVCATSLTVTATTTSATCNGNNGTATVTGIIGGQAPYSYLWSTVPVQNTSTATGLSAGNYTVTVADANGCLQGTQTVTISQPPTINVTVSSSTNVSCFGGHNGSAIASCSGGTGTLTYTWNTIPVQIGSTASNLIAGNYTVTIKDSTGCTASQSVTINQPSDITLTSNSTPSSCGVQNGSASVSGSGGIAPLTYLWLISPVQLTPTATGIGAGTYTVIVSDANGCTKSQKITVGGGAEPFANFITDPATISIFDPLVNFINTSTGNPVSWSWNFGDTTSGTNNISSNQNPSHVYSDTGLYCVTLIITDSTGVCKDTSTQCIRVDAPFTFYVPNAFTPNQDGRNEEFKAYGTYIREYHMAIFDRWGNLIFESNDINTGWNGKVKNRSVSPEEEDVYIWKAEITDIHYVVHKFIGHVSMLK